MTVALAPTAPSDQGQRSFAGHTRTRSLINSQLGMFWSPRCPPICPIVYLLHRFYRRMLCHRTQATVWDLLDYKCLEEWCATRLCAEPFLYLFHLKAGTGLLQGPCVSIETFGTFLKGCCVNTITSFGDDTVLSGLTRGYPTEDSSPLGCELLYTQPDR